MKAESSRIIARHVTKITINTLLPVYLTIYLVIGISRLITKTWFSTNPITILLASLLVTSATYNINFSLKKKGGVSGLIVSYIISATLVFLVWPQVSTRISFLKPEINWFEALLLCLPARLYLIISRFIRTHTDEIYDQIVDPGFNRWGRIAIEITRISTDTWLPTAVVTAFVFWFINSFTSPEVILPAEMFRIVFASAIATAASFDVWYTEYQGTIIRPIAITTSFVISASVVLLVWPIVANGIDNLNPNINYGTALLLCVPARLYMLLSGIITNLTE